MPARIPPVTSTTTPEATRPILEGIQKAIGMVPNLYATLGHSPAALKGYLALSEALSGGKLSPREAELLALHVSELNGCSYCLSAHTALATRAGASPEDAAAAREGQSPSRRERAIFALARRIVRTGGARAGRELAEAREAGLTDGEIVEVVAHVAARVFTNAAAILAETEIDFPRAPRLPSN
jgi:uncharacterized peroxidase-related enzyme